MKNTNLLATIVAGVTLLCLWLPAKAQHPCQDEVTQNSLWSAPSNVIDFGELDNPEVFPLPSHTVAPAISDYYYEGEEATNAHNAIHAQNGNLKYFIVDQFLYNRDGYSIGRLAGTVGDDPNTGNIKGNSEVMIVPDPANCERYYIFTSTHGNDGGNTAYYTLLDASVYNTESSLTVGEDVEGALLLGTGSFDNNCESLVASLTFLDSQDYEIQEAGHLNYHFAASPLNELDNSRLVIMFRGSQLFRVRLDDNGIHPINPVVTLNAGPSMVRSELELKLIEPTGQTPFYRAAIGGRDVLTVFEMDLSGQLIANSEYTIDLDEPWATDYAYVKGLEFSENGEYLYFTHHITLPSNPDAVQYLDFSDMSVSTLNVSPLNQSDFEFSQIELGVDGKLYFAYADGLAALEDSNDPNSTWNPLEISIPDYPLSDAGFPTQDPMKVYLLPDQIDGMNYYDHFFVTKECCMLHAPYDAFNATATTSATWSPGDNPFNPDPDCDVVLIHNELRIPEGVHITIEDMRFEFFENARVVVESGGSLTLERTIFTSGPCGCEMWLGVEVHGHPHLSQNFANQGFLDMKDNSIIEHAYIGVLAGSRNGSTNSSSLGYARGGGIVRARDSRFRNNKRDVQIQRYMATSSTGQIIPNFSKFTNCDFLTDGLLNHADVLPEYHALLYLVSRVPFINCSFRNTASFADLPIENRGIGVYSERATFQVTGDNQIYEPAHDALPISDDVHQTFYRLTSGVVVNGLENHDFTVSKMEFQLNQRGIDVFGVSKETITFNNFEIPTGDSQYTNGGLGAYLSNTYLFTVEENHFFSDVNLFNTGLVVDNSNKDASQTHLEVDNEVYRNTFDKLNIGISVVNNNRGGQRNTGLQTRCNQFSQANSADIYLTAGTEWKDDQGSGLAVEWLTNNVFSYAQYGPLVFYRDVRVHEEYGEQYSGPGLMFQYWCLQDDPTTKPEYDITNPIPIGQAHMEVTHDISHANVLLDFENHCPSNFTSGGGGKYPLAESLQRQAAAEDYLESAIAVYKATIDGGETEDVLDLLQNIYDEESAYLRDLLLSRHPLSREALIAALDAAEAFDPWHITQVMVANSKLPGDVYRFLETNEVLSPFFMQFVEDAQESNGANLGRLLYAEISHRSYEKSRAEREIHRHFLYHTDSVDYGAWSAYLQNRTEPHYILHRIGDHLDKGETGNAQALLDSLPIHEDRIDWVQFMIDIAAADTVTAADHSTGWDFFYNKPLTIGDAWGWLFAQGETDSLPPQPVIEDHRNFSLVNHDDKEKPERFLQAWPNPAKDRVMLTYPREAEGMGIVQMFDADGRLVHEFTASDAGFQEINITGWPTGLYIAKLIVNGKDFETVKISVVK